MAQAPLALLLLLCSAVVASQATSASEDAAAAAVAGSVFRHQAEANRRQVAACSNRNATRAGAFESFRARTECPRRWGVTCATNWACATVLADVAEALADALAELGLDVLSAPTLEAYARLGAAARENRVLLVLLPDGATVDAAGFPPESTILFNLEQLGGAGPTATSVGIAAEAAAPPPTSVPEWAAPYVWLDYSYLNLESIAAASAAPPCALVLPVGVSERQRSESYRAALGLDATSDASSAVDAIHIGGGDRRAALVLALQDRGLNAATTTEGLFGDRRHAWLARQADHGAVALSVRRHSARVITETVRLLLHCRSGLASVVESSLDRLIDAEFGAAAVFADAPGGDEAAILQAVVDLRRGARPGARAALERGAVITALVRDQAPLLGATIKALLPSCAEAIDAKVGALAAGRFVRQTLLLGGGRQG